MHGTIDYAKLPQGTIPNWRSQQHYRVPVNRYGDPREDDGHPFNVPGEPKWYPYPNPYPVGARPMMPPPGGWQQGKPPTTASIKTADDGTSLVGWMGWCAYNRKELDRSSLSEYAAISGMDAETYLEIYMFLANNNGIFREAAASGKRLYIPSHIAQHLGVSTPTMVSWLKQQEFPRATHTSNSHSLLWDNPTPWEEFAIRHKALGKQGRTPGWADDLSHQNPIRHLHGIADIAKDMDLPLNTVYHWYSRPNVKLSPPPSTHYVKGSSGGHDTYLWTNIDPIRNWHSEYKDTQGGGSSYSYSPSSKPQRENSLCPNCFTQHAGECL
jgi:hypothetical protein